MPNKKVNTEDKPTMVQIGAELKRLRKSKGLTIEGMAKELKMSRNTYSKLEDGLVYINISTLLKILRYHNVSLKDFSLKL